LKRLPKVEKHQHNTAAITFIKRSYNFYTITYRSHCYTPEDSRYMHVNFLTPTYRFIRHMNGFCSRKGLWRIDSVQAVCALLVPIPPWK